jgi:polyisoprenoid-binding protein YceI
VAAENPRRLEVRGEIDRRDYGLTWNRGIEATGVVSTRVQIELDLELGWRQGC